MEVFAGETFAETYKNAVSHVILNGRKIAPRGLKTIEVSPVTLHIKNPRARLGYHKARKFSLMFAVAESILLFAETNSLKYWTSFNKNMSDYSDDGQTLYGAYGKRIAPYIRDVVEKLSNDRNSRQAVLNITKNDDLKAKTKDYPCTVAIHFMIRNNSLNAHVFMRSNDLYRGTPYDVFQFTVLQEVIANTLGINVGEYYHTVSSLHIYESDIENTNKTKEQLPIKFYLPYTIYDMPRYLFLMIDLLVGNIDMSVEELVEIENSERLPFQEGMIQDASQNFGTLTPYAVLLYNEHAYRNKKLVLSLSDNGIGWALPYSKRWYGGK